MATKITDLAALGTNAASNDVLTIVDVSDTSGTSAGTSKKITVANLLGGGKQEFSTTLTRAAINALAGGASHTLISGTAGKIIVPTDLRFMITLAGSGTTTSVTQDLEIRQSTNLNAGLQAGLYPRTQLNQQIQNTTSASSIYYRDVPATGGRIFDENKDTVLKVPTGFVLPTKVTSITFQIRYLEITP